MTKHEKKVVLFLVGSIYFYVSKVPVFLCHSVYGIVYRISIGVNRFCIILFEVIVLSFFLVLFVVRVAVKVEIR